MILQTFKDIALLSQLDSQALFFSMENEGKTKHSLKKS